MTAFIINLILSLIIFSSGPGSNPASQSNDCLVKTSSEWGSNCSACFNSKESYRVNLKNDCDKNIDVVVAVKEKTNRWRTFRRNNMAPGDSISAYACEGAGKYMFWSRNADDKTVVLPSDEEIQKELSEVK